MVKVLIKRLDPKVNLPKYKTSGSSGMDLMAFIKSPIKIKAGMSALIPTGVSIAFPEEFEVQIRPRSGLAAKQSIGVLNTPGTIDSDYRGEIKIIIYNHGNEDFEINNGDIISIVSNLGNVSVTVSGEAQDSGNLGDLIKVKNLKSGKIIKGYIKKDKKIKIFR